VRRPIDLTHPKLIREVISFDPAGSEKKWAKDDVFCCLEQPSKVAESKGFFYKVDATIYELAKLARKRRFAILLVT